MRCEKGGTNYGLGNYVLRRIGENEERVLRSSCVPVLVVRAPIQIGTGKF
jgi:hypothetical protein